MRDPYVVLGLGKDASTDDIKKAYRKKAKILHPDYNKSDPKAQEKFSELTNAYDLLNDKDKRRAYDSGEIDAEGKPKFSGFSGGHGGGFPGGDSVFEQFVHGGRGFRAKTSHSAQGAGFEDFFDVLSGMTGGRAGGAHQESHGHNPFGAEFSTQRRQNDLDETIPVSVPFLEAARGARQRVTLPSGATIEVAIPAGTRDGHKLRLKGKGRMAPTGQTGDAYILIKLEPHPNFSADGKDVRLDLPVALDEAILGGAIRVPTLDGQVELKLPAMTSSGKTFRLRGKGLPSPDGAGDLYVTVRIMLPEGDHEALEALANTLKTNRTSDPRANL